MPRIGVAIATTGDDLRLKDTLNSIAAQDLKKDDVVYLTVDGKPTWDIRGYIEIVLGGLVQAVYEEAEKRSDAEWGHFHMNKMFDDLNLNVDVILAQDQDDIFAPRAFEMIREQSKDGDLLMTRVYNHAWGLLWRVPNWDEPLDADNPAFTAEGFMALDGHCPAIPTRNQIPHFGLAYAGDQELIQACRLMFWNKTKWVDTISTITRPRETLGWRLYPVAVRTKDHAEALRQVRNTCREFMTGATGEISEREQQEWWESLDKETNWLWLFVNPANRNEVAGFVYLRKDVQGTIWQTYGLAPKWRGSGYGEELVQFAVLAAQGESQGEVLQSNAASVRLNDKLGARFTDNEDGILGYIHAWPPAFLAQKGLVG